MASQDVALFKSTLQLDSDSFLRGSAIVSQRVNLMQKKFQNLGTTLSQVSKVRPLVLAPALDQSTESAGRLRQMLTALKIDQEQVNDQVGVLNNSLVESAIPTVSQYENQLAGLSRQFTLAEETSRGLKDVTRAIGTAFEDAVVEGQAFSDVLKGLGKDLIRIFQRVAITKPLEATLTELFASGLSGVSFSGGSAIGPLFGPGFAAGGRPPIGVPSLVGERGPELFIPGSAGTIIPNKDLAHFGGGSTINIDLRGSNGSQEIFQTVQKAIKTAAPAIVNQAVVTVKDGRRRDPSFFSR